MKNLDTISDVLRLRAKKNSNKIFVINNKKRYTYSEINQLVDRCCFFFQELKIKEREIVSFSLINSVEFLILYFACIRSNILANPLPHTLSKFEIKQKVNFLKSKYFFSDQEINIKSKFYYIDKNENNSFLKNLKKLDTNNKEFKTKVKKKDTAVLYYSSGTTNDPKIIEYSYNAMLTLQKAMKEIKFTNFNTNHMCILPMGHTSVLRYSVKQALYVGGTIFIYESFWSIKNNFWKIIKKNKINFVQLVPSIVVSLLNLKAPKPLKFKIKFGCGSDKIDNKIKNIFEKKFFTKLLNLYGLSEIGASHFEQKNNKKNNSIGKPLKIYNCKIFKSKNKLSNLNEVGELGVKSKAIFNGYYKNKILTKKSFNKLGYFLTGDLCSKDNKNNYFYHGRKKDLIIKGGVNINPNEIDEVVESYNKNILKSVTIGVNDHFLGQRLKTFILLKKKIIKLKKLDSFLLKKLGQLKKPDNIIIVDKFPQTSTGKIIKRYLK